MSGKNVTHAEFIGDESAQRLLRRAQQVANVSKRINSVGPGFRSVRNEEFGDDARYETQRSKVPMAKTGGAKKIAFSAQFS